MHNTRTLYVGEAPLRTASREDASAWLAATSRPSDILFGYDPLFLGAWERNRSFSDTVVPRADTKLALRVLYRAAEAARPRSLGARRERQQQLHAEAAHPAALSTAGVGLRGPRLRAVPRRSGAEGRRGRFGSSCCRRRRCSSSASRSTSATRTSTCSRWSALWDCAASTRAAHAKRLASLASLESCAFRALETGQARYAREPWAAFGRSRLRTSAVSTAARPRCRRRFSSWVEPLGSCFLFQRLAVAGRVLERGEAGGSRARGRAHRSAAPSSRNGRRRAEQRAVHEGAQPLAAPVFVVHETIVR